MSGRPPLETRAPRWPPSYGLTCVVTLGGAGCIAVTAAEAWRVPVLPITPGRHHRCRRHLRRRAHRLARRRGRPGRGAARGHGRRGLHLRAGRRPDRPAEPGHDPGPAARAAAGHPAVKAPAPIAAAMARVSSAGPTLLGRSCSTGGPCSGAPSPCRPSAPPAPLPPRAGPGLRRQPCGSPIGRHGLRFTQDGARTTAEITIELQVKLAFITVYRYRHVNRELWDGDDCSASRAAPTTMAPPIASRRAARGTGSWSRATRARSRRPATHCPRPIGTDAFSTGRNGSTPRTAGC